MGQDDQVSLWLERLRDGDERAPGAIWKQYFEKLVRLARRRLGEMPKRAVDEEDVALSAMNSLFRGAEAGRFPKLEDRDDLWKILVTITARKAMKQQRRHFADKRGGGKVHGESIFSRGGDDSDAAAGIDQVLGNEPTPELADQVSNTCGEMITQLQDDTLERVVLFKLEGYTNDEIAQELDCTTRTVERKLERIRDKWSRGDE
jgi:RNA polymerase sigma factor (sigma-70 family)